MYTVKGPVMKSKIILVLIILIAAILAGCSSQSAQQYDAPEKVVQSYVAGVVAADYNALLQLCPADTMEKNFNSDLYSKSALSNEKVQNADGLKANYAAQTGSFAAGLLSGEISLPTTPINETWTQQFFKGADSSKLKDLKILRIDKPYISSYSFEADSDVYKESMKPATQVWGANAITERIVLLQHNGKTFMAGFTLIEYGTTWGIQNVSSNFGIVLSNPQQTTQQEYLKYVSPSAQPTALASK
jgi:hypothetical protein